MPKREESFELSNRRITSESEVTQSRLTLCEPCTLRSAAHRAPPSTVTPWTVVHQAPPSTGFSTQEYRSGLPFLWIQGSQSFPGGSDGKESPAMWETWVRSLGWEDPLEEGMATHSSILAWGTPRQRSLVGCIPQGHKESNMTEQLSTAQHKDHSYN